VNSGKIGKERKDSLEPSGTLLESQKSLNRQRSKSSDIDRLNKIRSLTFEFDPISLSLKHKE
jgi:hypothetical protein